MDVSELITHLQKLPPHMPVVFLYDDVECGYMFSEKIGVSLETLKLTENEYYSTGPYVRMKDGKQVELPFTPQKVVLLTVG